MPKKTIPRERLPALQKSYDDLCLWLNFDDGTKYAVRHLLESEYVKPFFREYRRDYLESNDHPSSSSNSNGISPGLVLCSELYNWCIGVDAFAQAKYFVDGSANISKKYWDALDHAARFVVCVLRFSWENEGEWSHGEFDPHNDEDGQGELEFFRVWAILQYLHAEWEAANLDDWGMECLTETFSDMMPSRL